MGRHMSFRELLRTRTRAWVQTRAHALPPVQGSMWTMDAAASERLSAALPTCERTPAGLTRAALATLPGHPVDGRALHALARRVCALTGHPEHVREVSRALRMYFLENKPV